MPFEQLSEIADRHWCDKGLIGPSSRHSGHNYADVYHAYLNRFRGEDINLLEIGLGVLGPHCQPRIVGGKNSGGASMKMWAEYFPTARISGIDINPAPQLDTDRVKTYVVDQGSRESIGEFLDQHPDPLFDVIIDDGSHRADHQQISLEMLFPRLKPGGLYFIEDLNDFGHGGRADGPYATPGTVSTRDFFEHFARSGEPLNPNAFGSVDFLDSVADVSLHCPKPVQRPRDLVVEAIRTALGRSRRGLLRTEWLPHSEQVVVLRKSA